MDIHDRDELWTEHDGQSRVLDYNKVADEITRLQRELAAARAEVACLTKHRDGLLVIEGQKDAEIERLLALLKHADDVVIWEHTPARSGFQEEIEAALGIGLEQSTTNGDSK